jgi:hypothetical protein
MRLVARVGLIAASVAAAAFVAATPAAAAPTGCTTGALNPNGGFSYCSGGTGWHQVNILCRVNPYYTYWWGGPKVGPGDLSIGYCNSGETRVSLSYSTGG